MSKPVLILVAAGSSTRIGMDKSGQKIKKEYLPLNGGTVLSEAAKAFISTLDFQIVAVTYPFSSNSDELNSNETKCKEALFADPIVKNASCKFLFVPGGETRQKSVFEALQKINAELPEDENPVVFIHDGARPFVKSETISLTERAAQEFGAAAPGLRPIDTQKEIDENGFIKRHLERANLIAIQTPQAFKIQHILEAHSEAAEFTKEFTDDTEIWDEYATKHKNLKLSHVKIVMGDPENKKITYQNDLDFIK
ncbi:MAG: 2-C-methyl-D-erythritol 4-phosphate cytidylyltransferase [Treponema sp.]|nr:2-C-methyl-D-erythritol 4-phosphate cytidylyltransferase [Candidatus Treponema equifaecale]